MYMERTKAQRQAEVLPILQKLTELGVKAAEHVEIRVFSQNFNGIFKRANALKYIFRFLRPMWILSAY